MLPVLVGVIVAVHLESVALKDTHVPENAPRGVAEPPLLNETVPTGVDRVPAATSTTSAVSARIPPTTTEADEHVSTVDVVFFFNDTATTEIYTLSLHDALPIL